jgi:hypothetical protein
MGKIVFAGAMSHVLDPDYYQRACGDEGRRKTVECMAEIARMGERLTASKPDACRGADDHWCRSFNAVPALCVRISHAVQRMKQDHAEAFDAVPSICRTVSAARTASRFSRRTGHRVRPGHVLGAPVDHAFLGQ